MLCLRTAIAEQTVEPGAAVVFDGAANRLARRSGRLCRGVYEARFSGNVTGTAPVELTMYVGGEPLPETRAVSNVAGAQNLAIATAFRAYGGEGVTVVNTGDAAVTITDASLLIGRVE